jgi:hypothetical protein
MAKVPTMIFWGYAAGTVNTMYAISGTVRPATLTAGTSTKSPFLLIGNSTAQLAAADIGYYIQYTADTGW